jgi:DNA-binding transcriptional MocR family regulator
VIETLEENLGGKGISDWTQPNGGYFISFNTLPNCAKAVVAKAAEAGVALTPAGATFPYRHDPEDRNIRIAPTFPKPEELKKAIQVFCTCVQLVSVEMLIKGQS